MYFSLFSLQYWWVFQHVCQSFLSTVLVRSSACISVFSLPSTGEIFSMYFSLFSPQYRWDLQYVFQSFLSPVPVRSSVCISVFSLHSTGEIFNMYFSLFSSQYRWDLQYVFWQLSGHRAQQFWCCKGGCGQTGGHLHWPPAKRTERNPAIQHWWVKLLGKDETSR